ncbi:MAG: MFS transporter [Thermus sp.]|uniref:MFS transporter n=1 Tax=Thermus sp. TaxID=275 RepID=UPI00331976B3
MLALALLQDPGYRAYWLSLLASQLGTWMQSAAQAWLVLLLTGSAERLGLVVAFQFLPSLLLSLPAGVLADRYPRRRLLLFTQGGMAFLAFLMAFLILFGRIRYGHVLGFALLYGAMNALDLPVRQAYTVELAGRERYPGAIALNSFGFNLSRLLGPVVGGVLIAQYGVGVAFLLNALSFVPLLFILLGKEDASPAEDARRPFLKEGLEGLRYVWETPRVRFVVGVVFLTSLFVMNFQTLVPAYARLALGLSATGYGALLSAVGLGALVAALGMALRGRPSLAWVVGGGVLLGLVHLALALKPSPAWAAFFFALGGFAMISVLINANTAVQLEVPDRLRGRVMSVYSLFLLGTGPLGAYLTGALFDRLGGGAAAGVLGGLALLGLFFWLRAATPRV